MTAYTTNYIQKRLSGTSRSASLMLVSELFSSALRVIQGIILIKLLTPTELGLWTGLLLISTYGAHSHLGILNGITRQVPFYRGIGNEEKVNLLLEASKAWVFLLSLVWGLATIFAILILYKNHDLTFLFGLITIGLSMTMRIQSQYFNSSFRASQQFDRVSAVKIAEAIVLFMGVSLVAFFGFIGLCLRYIVFAFVSLFSSITLDTFRVKAKWDSASILELLKIGVPIFIVGFSLVMLTTLDRIIILQLLDVEALGFYYLALTMQSVLILVPSVMGQVIYPQLSERFGRLGFSKEIVFLAAKTSIISSVSTLFFAAIFYVSVPWVIESFFPIYSQGIEPMKVLLIASVPLGLAIGPYYLLNTMMQQGILLISFTTGALALYLSSYYLVNLGYGLPGIAWGKTIGLMTYALSLWGSVFVLWRKRSSPLPI